MSREHLERLAQGGIVDASLSNGVVRSSKEVYALRDDQGVVSGYGIFHAIDGSDTYFTEHGITEVFDGTRSPWDGDFPPPATNLGK